MLDPALPTSPQDLLKKLDDLRIAYTLYEHEAVFTVAESEKLKGDIPGRHTRNMFLRTKKKDNFLVTLSDKTPVDLKKLGVLLNAKNFSFGSAGRLMETLGVFPGSVTPFSVINAAPGDIAVILEKSMMQAELVAYHPLVNTMTVTVTPQDLLDFVTACGHQPQIVDLDPVAP